MFGLPFDVPDATQRFEERFALAFTFGFAADFLAAFAFGFADFAEDFAALGGAGGGGTNGLAYTGGVMPPVSTVGFSTGRELDVLSGGNGCLRGRPLLRAAWPSAISLSNAAFASASNRACWEVVDVVARAFSARKRSSGLVCFIGSKYTANETA